MFSSPPLAPGSDQHGPDPSSRERTGVLRRSCETCRNLKARCVALPDSDHKKTCKRCVDNGLDCVFEEAIARPKRARPVVRTRVKDVEERIDSLIALIASQNGAYPGLPQKTPPSLNISSFPADPPWQQPPPPPPPLPGGFSLSNITAHSSWLGPGFPAATPMTDMALSTTTTDVFSTGIVTVPDAERCLAAFAAAADQSMPFIFVAPHMTLDFLRRERPCLLLAVLAVFSDNPLQERLLAEFKRYIAQAIVVEARKDIDIVQGLIVYCNWHNRCTNPNVHQLYQLFQLAMTIALEIGMPSLAHLREMDSQRAKSSRTHRDLDSQYSDDLERMRTYVGCYHLSHSLAIAVRKPASIRHSRRIQEAARVIAKLDQAPSDALIPHLVGLQRLAEEVERAFEFSDPDGLDDMDGPKIQAIVNVLNRELSRLLEEMPPAIKENTEIKLEVLFLRMAITEIAFEVPAGHRSTEAIARQQHCCDWCSSALRTELVIASLRTAHAYIHFFRALPDAVIRSLNVLQVGRLVYAMLLLSRARMRDRMARLDMAVIGEIAAFRHYLELSASRLAPLVVAACDPVTGRPKRDLLWMFHQMFTAALSWFANAELNGEMDVRYLDVCGAEFKMEQAIMAPSLPSKEDCKGVMASNPPSLDSRSSSSTTPETASEPSEPADATWLSDQDMMWTADMTEVSPDTWYGL